MGYKIKLFRIKSNHQNLRTETIEGTALDLPALQEDFYLYGKGLEFGTRVVRTTPVTAMARVGETILFQTKNSTYTLLIEGESKPEEEKPSEG